MKLDSKQKIRWFGLVISLPALFLLATGLAKYARIQGTINQGIETEGQVIYNELGEEGLSYPFVTFADTNGQQISAVSRDHFKLGRYRVGQTLPIVYLAEAPEDFVINVTTVRQRPYIDLVFGAIFGVVALAVVLGLLYEHSDL